MRAIPRVARDSHFLNGCQAFGLKFSVAEDSQIRRIFHQNRAERSRRKVADMATHSAPARAHHHFPLVLTPSTRSANQMNLRIYCDFAAAAAELGRTPIFLSSPASPLPPLVVLHLSVSAAAEVSRVWRAAAAAAIGADRDREVMYMCGLCGSRLPVVCMCGLRRSIVRRRRMGVLCVLGSGRPCVR